MCLLGSLLEASFSFVQTDNLICEAFNCSCLRKVRCQRTAERWYPSLCTAAKKVPLWETPLAFTIAPGEVPIADEVTYEGTGTMDDVLQLERRQKCFQVELNHY